MEAYASYLGFAPRHTELFWIAECALSAPVPEGFQEFVDDDGDIFYYEGPPSTRRQAIQKSTRVLISLWDSLMFG